MIGEVVACPHAICLMSNVGMSDAPSGATHWSDSNRPNRWFKFSDGQWFYWVCGKWVHQDSEVPEFREVLYPVTNHSEPTIEVGSEWFVGVDGELYKTKIVGKFVVGHVTYAYHIRRGDVDSVHLTTDPSIFVGLDDFKGIDQFLKESQIRKMVDYLCGEEIVGNPSRETITEICEELVAANLVKID